jgi:hypothetical protein
MLSGSALASEGEIFSWKEQSLLFDGLDSVWDKKS